MLGAFIIGADPALARDLETAIQEVGRFDPARTTEEFPPAHDLERLIRAHAPHTAFVCVDNLEEALECRRALDQTVPGMPVVAFGRHVDQTTLLQLMKTGVREFLPVPFEVDSLDEIADRIGEQLAKTPLSVESTDKMFTFVPAKPGVGATTLAVNLSVAFSEMENTRVLLADFDLNSGLIDFMLRVDNTCTVIDAAMRADALDETLWPELVVSRGKLDLLPCGPPDPGVRVRPEQIHALLNFARRHYDVICADLSGNMEKYAIELMMESKRIFLVTTAEIPPLHLARQRLELLGDLDLLDRVSVLLNRSSRHNAISLEQVQDLLGLPVFETFPNSYLELHQALVDGAPISPASDFGKRNAQVARRIIAPQGAEAEEKQKKGFFENLSFLSSRLSESR
jgi:pilus assembly protein CpaE